MERKTRNRGKKPQWQYAGLDLDRWRSENERVIWAQKTPEFKDILTVMTNERRQALFTNTPISEPRGLGRLEGYEMALNVLRLMAEPSTPPLQKTEDINYRPDLEQSISLYEEANNAG